MPLAAAVLAAVTLAVQPTDGSLNLSLGEKRVVSGVLTQSALTIEHTVVRADDPAHYTVEVAYTDHSTAVYSYALKGSDCTLTYALTNHGKEPRAIDLGGLNCTLTPGVKLTGTIPFWHWTYYANKNVFHPSVLSPLGVVDASDGQAAAVFYSPSEIGRQSLINATFRVNLSIPNPFNVEFHTTREVAPGATDSATLVIRLVDDLSPAARYAPYKALLAEHYPVDLYVSDARAAGMSSSVDKAWVTPENPHGYNGDMRRFDRPEGVALFLQKVADPLAAAGAQGCLFWAPGGVEPIMYPPEFDDNLARISPSWPAMVTGLQARKLRVGLCARPAEYVDRSDPARALVKRIDPNNVAQVETMLARFRRAATMGVNAYYLDTFGHDLPSTKLLPAIRQTVGPDVPLYTEYATDATLPYADHYCEYRSGDSVSWTSPQQFQALRYLFPRSVWLCVSRTPEPVPADFARLHLTPLVQDYLVPDAFRDKPAR